MDTKTPALKRILIAFTLLVLVSIGLSVASSDVVAQTNTLEISVVSARYEPDVMCPRPAQSARLPCHAQHR